MGHLSHTFEERLREIDAYLDLLDAIQVQIGKGHLRTTSNGVQVTVQQQRILHSSVYLQLYNLVEATITRCVDAVSEAAAQNERWRPHDLSDKLRKQWVRALIRADEGLNVQNQLAGALDLSDWLINERPVKRFTIRKGGGGNWDDTQIEKFTEKLGLVLEIPEGVKQEVRKRRRNDKGALGLIKALRNDLAHGKLSFEECGADDTVSDLRVLKDWTAAYLREVVIQFEAFIDTYEFLAPERRPARTGT